MHFKFGTRWTVGEIKRSLFSADTLDFILATKPLFLDPSGEEHIYDVDYILDKNRNPLLTPAVQAELETLLEDMNTQGINGFKFPFVED